MALKIGKKELGGWKKRAIAMKTRMDRASVRTGAAVATAVHTSEVSAASFISGVLQGRYGGVEVLGVPIDLGLAALLHVGGFLGLAGKMSIHLHGFGDGFLASFLTTTGRGVGKSWKERALAAPASAQGELPSRRGGSFLTDDERRMAAAAARV